VRRPHFRAPRIRTRNGRLFLFALLVGLVSIPINAAYSAALPIISEVAESSAVSKISAAVEKCAEACDFSGLAKIEYDPAGAVCGVICDARAVNAARSGFTAELLEMLEHDAVRIRVRIGDVIGSPATIGRGPSIPVRVTGYGAAVSEVESKVESAGINQSLYTLYINVTVTATLILPRGETAGVEYSTTVPMAQTLVVGGVPDYYNGY